MGVRFRNETIALEGLTQTLHVALLADSHLKSKKSFIVLKEAIEGVNDLDVDLVFLLGDYLHNSKRNISALSHFGELEARYGVYAVLGNHDCHISGPWDQSDEDYTDWLTYNIEREGITVLRDSSVEIETPAGSLTLVGVNSYWHQDLDIDAAFAGVDDETLTILLSHHPHMVRDIPPEYRTDLVLSGHTHGYNFRVPSGKRPMFPFLPPYFGGPFDRGLEDYDGRLTYVTSGLWNGPPIPRIFNPPEVVLLELCPLDSE